MSNQHSTGEEGPQVQGIVVPLELDGLHILKQERQADGKLRASSSARRKGRRVPIVGRYVPNSMMCVHGASVMSRCADMQWNWCCTNGVSGVCAVTKRSPKVIVPVVDASEPPCDYAKRLANKPVAAPSPMWHTATKSVPALCKPVWRS